jgi:hypothetical protein
MARKCKACRTVFEPLRPLQNACGIECALVLAAAGRVKREKSAATADRRETRAKLEKLKSRAQWAREAQAMVNKYVRLRDAGLGCVSCDKPASWPGQWHASHFRSVGAAPGLRFNLWNIHKACSVCNNHLSGNLAGYLPRLISKIGLDRVEWLQSQNAVDRRSAEYFERVKAVFSRKAKRMEIRNAMLC